jgi:glutaredoxin-like domain DUF836
MPHRRFEVNRLYLTISISVYSKESIMKLTLMFREYCSLCHKMREQLKPYQERFGFELEILDVDEDPVLEEKYNELVPVLLDGQTEICHWFLDEEKLKTFLETKCNGYNC